MLDKQKDALLEIQQKFLAHFTFLLILATRASVASDEVKMVFLG